jgi:hypothetical protein
MQSFFSYLESKQNVSNIFDQDLKYLLEIRNNKNWQLIRELQILNFEIKLSLDFCDQAIHGIVNTKTNYFLKIKAIRDDIDFAFNELGNISLIFKAKDEFKEYTHFIDDPKIVRTNHYIDYTTKTPLMISELDFIFNEDIYNSWKFI